MADVVVRPASGRYEIAVDGTTAGFTVARERDGVVEMGSSRCRTPRSPSSSPAGARPGLVV